MICDPSKLMYFQPLLYRGTGFTEEERTELGLHGLLPPRVETIEAQAARFYEAYSERPDGLARYRTLRQLQDQNETLFYRVLSEHLEEMLPIVYTPVVGEACMRFSHMPQRPRGLYLSYPNRERIDEVLRNHMCNRVQVIVATDGERILGLGDQGAGGMGIPIGKLSLYTACAGIDPASTLPVMLDLGTDNRELLDDPMYIGWRHERIRGAEYDSFIDMFVKAVERCFPSALLQWEDFAKANAAPLLERYRDELCSFNDDIQGTAAVTWSVVLGALGAAGRPIDAARFVIAGAGAAGCGIADTITAALQDAGVGAADARARIFMLGSRGLLIEGDPRLSDEQRPFAKPRAAVEGWKLENPDEIRQLDVVRNTRPDVLVGVTGIPSLFDEATVRAMAACTERPVILPLSNPTTKSEARPADLLAWTEGRALVATGSPFAPVQVNGRRVPIAQCNNCYIFPGVGLGVVASGARRVTDGMFLAAARALAHQSPARVDPTAPLLPPLADIRASQREVALAVAREAQAAGLTALESAAELEEAIDRSIWEPVYQPLAGAAPA